MGKIVTLGEMVANVYREDAASEVELPFTAPAGRRRTWRSPPRSSARRQRSWGG